MGHYNKSKKVRRRKVAHLASVSRLYSVNNTTIPKADLTSNNFKEVEQFGHKMYVNTDIQENGNGKKWKKEKHLQPKSLTKKELKTIYKRHLDLQKKMGIAEFMEAMTNHKLAKWEKKNPCPVKENQNPPDLFEEQYLIPWKGERDKAIERIRDFVVSVYDKLHVVGNKKSKYKLISKTVALVKDTDQKGHDVNHPSLKETDKLYKIATNAAQKAMDKDPEIIDCDLLNHKKDQKRPLYNAKRSGFTNLKQKRRTKKAA